MPHARPATPRCPDDTNDRPCPRLAGFGTDHPGTGRCRFHELQAAAAARAERVGEIPQAVFLEARYVDGLPYADTAPRMAPAEDGTAGGDEWGYDDAGRVVDLRGATPRPFPALVKG